MLVVFLIDLLQILYDWRKFGIFLKRIIRLVMIRLFLLLDINIVESD